MVIVGDGPDMKDLMDLSQKKNLSKNIIFTGRVMWEDVPKYYALSDVFTTASTTETQGLTVIEAMGASKLVVAIDDDSFKNVITDKKDGLLFTDDKTYVNLIYEMYKDKDKRRQIQKEARKTADKYSPVNYASQVASIYNKVLNKDTNVFKKTFHDIRNAFEKSGDKK